MNDEIKATLEWYGEQARLARLIHHEGDAGRHALADDGGKRARDALAALDTAPTPSPDQIRMESLREDPFFELVVDGIAEADKAMRKFPQPNYVISKVAEEAGEVVKAAIHHAEGRETAESVKAEMRQLIAMLFRLYIEGDQVHGMAPLITGGDDDAA